MERVRTVRLGGVARGSAEYVVAVAANGEQADAGLLSERRALSSTAARQADITLTVDGKQVTVPQGTSTVPTRVPPAHQMTRLRAHPGLRGRWGHHTTVSPQLSLLFRPLTRPLQILLP